LSGAAGVGLQLDVECRPNPIDAVADSFLSLSGVIYVGTTENPMQFVGLASPKWTTAFPPSGQSSARTCHLVLVLHDQDIDEIERSRAGGQLEVVADLSAVVFGPVTIAGWCQERWPVEPAAWERVLEDSRRAFRLGVLVDRRRDQSDERRRADDALDRAFRALRQGRYGDVCMAVRQVLEVLALSESASRPPTNRHAPVDERFARLAKSLEYLVGAAVHTDHEHTWRREEAVLILATASGLVARHDLA
jgi:hypothetical protein